MKTMKELHEKYGIPLVESPEIYPAKNLPRLGATASSDEAKPDWQAIGKRVMEEHRDVLRALARR